MHKQYKINQQIKYSPLRLINETGENLGIVPLEEAVRLVIEKGLDLVEISSTAKPPVCRMIDFKKFKYLEEKSEKQAKKKTKVIELKVARITLNASENDLKTKLKNINNFLKLNNSVKIVLNLKGREKNHVDLAFTKFKSFLTMIEGEFRIIQEIKKQGWNISAIITK
ncbi:translation initiation factor IF-3 [Candidatus Azambacteria bacterium]|nr:translation initiation factor IF-3 [Candidatus Azambacteria bacterium]